MVEIKKDENASEASDQDPRDDVWCFTYNMHDVAKSWQSIGDPTTMT